ncbi:hypothetical protein Pelo_7456 [Pelomyxa schiedti]|nr:hypothetical protein Pelo_7456 [Pelomyxa schiedti]
MGCCCCTSGRDRRNFRGSYYHKNVCCGKRTVKRGECCATWNLSGEYSVHEGPVRIWMFCSEVAFLDRATAGPNQYLVVKRRDGVQENIPGPYSMFKDPVIHVSVDVCDSIALDASELCVIYSQPTAGEAATAAAASSHSHSSSSDEVEMTTTTSTHKQKHKHKGKDKDNLPPAGTGVRRLLRGPDNFIPTSTERAHQFEWSPADPNAKTKVTFQKLKLIVQSLKCVVEGVRTTDKILLAVEVMIFWDIVDVERMLDNTSDPVGEIRAATAADIVSFGSNHSYESLLSNTPQLSELDPYRMLVTRATAFGVAIRKVIYNGYRAEAGVQRVHDHALETRAKLKAEHEQNEHEQAQIDLKLKHEFERTKREGEHNALMREQAEIQERFNLEMEKVKHAAALQRKQQEEELEQMARRRAHETDVAFYKELANIGVNVTQYLVAANQKPANQVVKIDQGTGEVQGITPTHVHLHEAPSANEMPPNKRS